VPYCVCSEPQKYLLKKGDIVFARTGATVGKSFLITEDPENAIFASYLIRLRTKPEYISSNFLYYFFQSQLYWNQIIEQAIGGAQSNVNGTKLASIKLNLPDNATQEKIVKELDELSEKVTELKKLQESQLADLKSLEQAYLREAFSGELV
jgi:type I restriction enzyme S subunit